MEERCVVAGALVEGGMNRLARVANISESQFAPMELSPEQKEKYRAENEAREKEYRKQTIARAVLELAERLVMRGKTPEQALGIATDFITRANETLNTFSLPE